jgi:16S rRNA (uracil1498-N3)-methyltransferase
MVLPLFHISSTDAAAATVGGSVLLTGAEGRHAVSVRRMRVGEGIQLSDGAGKRIGGTVVAVATAELTVLVSEVTDEPGATPALELVQALAKGDRDEMAVQAATELGILSVIPWQAERSVSRWEGAKVAKNVERWRTIAAEASKQALRAWIPSVANPVTTKQLAQLATAERQLLVLDPTAEQAITQVDLPSGGVVSVVVGPEGGISPAELAVLAAAGAKLVRLGSEVLRTSTAGLAAISILQARLSRW